MAGPLSQERRPLEAELARMGYALVPAEPPNMIFADGAELTLPTDRGGQYATLADAYGRQVGRALAAAA